MPEPETDSAEVFDALDTGLTVVGADGRVLIWNSWLAAASDIAAELALGRSLEAIFPDGLPSRLNTAVNEAIASGASSLLTHTLHPRMLPLRTRTGKLLVHNISVRPLGDKPYSRCIIQISDVTAASERERVLRERQNARYAAVVDNAPDAILTVDADGLVQLANPTAASTFGYISAEIIAQPVSLLFDSPDAWSDIWNAVLSGEVMRRPVELVARRKDGRLSYLEVSAARWIADSRTFVTVILRDVNERHAAEAALRRLNETLEERVATTLAERKLLADIVETTDAFIQVLDFDYRFLAVNKASADEFERAFGARPTVGASLLDLLAGHPEERDAVQALWARALAGEDYTVVREIGDDTEGRRYHELKFDVLRGAAGEQIAAFQFVYDVTERMEHQARLAQAEEALRQSQKMEAIGQLTGGIAHDFNNLLTGIIGAMDVLQRRLAAGRYEDTQRFMDAAVTSANRAAALTHRLLAFARRQPLDPKPTDANHLVRSMEDLLRRTLSERIQLHMELASDLWPVLTDPNQLENAVLNLAINARDAMPDGGKLTISTRNIEFTEPFQQGPEEIAAGEYTVITVSDTGVGIEPEILAKVFEPFFTTKPLGQGTGLGLSMIYGFAKQTRGSVRIESTVGQGAQVSLYLPRHIGDMAGERASSAAELPAGSGEAVLLVEDDPSVRLLIGEVLRDLGYACIEAIDGQAALPMLLSNARLDLMITDVGLPGMNGRQLAERAREHRPDLKILFVTGYAEHATGSGFLGPGMEMVTKPFTLDALALKIREILAAKI
jgi:PAS domain S-box-containing protein